MLETGSQPTKAPDPFSQSRACGLRRPGISLIEIMISIGIVGIGLIGVAALIPLAHHKAAQGIQEDRKTQFGKRAVREFRVRGMDRPGSISSPGWRWVQTPNLDVPRNLDGSVVRQAYCLDPLLIAVMGKTAATFPMAGTIPRLTIVNSPVGLKRTNDPTMTLAQAQEVFALRDDLVMQRSPDQNPPAWLGYLTVTSGSQRIATKMLSGGGYSWLATLVPDPQTVGNQYTLSIVVIQGRNLTSPIPEEVTAQVVPAASMMVGLVKDVRLKQVTQSVGEFGLAQLREGNWIALGQTIPPNPPLYPLPRQILKWYRVTAVDQPDNSTDRVATLDGPDWNVNFNLPLYAICMRGVVAVYEKTIRLQDSTVYTQDLPPI